MTSPDLHALPSGSVVGILGGGQLGRMMAHAAHRLGYKTHIFTTKRGSATQVSSRKTVARYDDEEALRIFAEGVDVVTYEFENVPASTAAFLAQRVPVRPGPRALEVAQHRAREKTFMRDEVGAETAPWGLVETAEDAVAQVQVIGTPCVLKTATSGYDGKGQIILREGDDPVAAWHKLTDSRDDKTCILEGFVDFAFEASVVVARDIHGAIAPFDMAENDHKNHVLHRSTVPSQAPVAVAREAQRIASRIVEVLDYVGVMGVEFFVTHDDRVLVNEVAPRPHNSGHWTMDACISGQFDQAIRAAVGHPLGSPRRLVDVEMVNLLGDDVAQVDQLLREPNLRMHLYGKTDVKPGRKMGHFTRLRPLGSR
jgi:5-(carboxyamino)imidazole ribonucleotide synthase